MVLSMTGFAAKTVTLEMPTGGVTDISLVVKAVNSRYFEFSCKLPYPLQPIEPEILSTFREHARRGRINLISYATNPSAFNGITEPSIHVIKNYLQAIDHVQKTCTIPGTLTISDLVKIPELFGSTESTANEKIKSIIMTTVQELCSDLFESRKIEGAALAADIKKRCVALSSNIQIITTLAEANFMQRKEKVLETLKPLEDVKDSEILRHQLQIELNKAEITEEVVRFNSHLTTLQTILANKELEKGKHIDFIIQELVREINTIASKSTDAEISKLVIGCKVELEKIREQVQNIL